MRIRTRNRLTQPGTAGNGGYRPLEGGSDHMGRTWSTLTSASSGTLLHRYTWVMLLREAAARCRSLDPTEPHPLGKLLPDRLAGTETLIFSITTGCSVLGDPDNNVS